MNKSLPLTVVAGALALSAVPLLSTATARPAAAPAMGDIVDIAVGAGRFDTLVAAVTAAGLDGALKGPGPFTVFAPTDDAFAQLPPATLQFLLDPANVDTLTDILTYHVVPGGLLAGDVLSKSALDTLNGQRLDVSLQNGLPFVDGAQIVVTDIQASNGVIHVIDSVMTPSFTHIPRTADQAGTFTTLLAAVKAAGLANALQDGGPFTVLAPTDAAFAALPQGLLQELLKPENKQRLVSILTYHVIPDRVFSDQAAAAGQATSLSGKQLDFMSMGGKLFVEGAEIIAPDIDASNGVIHVIDSVLLPPAK
jgi:uncharacterized surface protein with fasciclin (FAS1) repeats